MKKFINDTDSVLSESLDGLCGTHPDLQVAGPDRKFIRRARLKPGKVGLISGGGSGHEPLHAGFVGLGMLDAACPGEVFTAPTPDQMMEAAEAVDTGAGLLFIVKNYEGDVMNFDMARELSEAICSDLGNSTNGNAIVLVNGFGGTPAMELYVMFNAVKPLLEKHGVRIARSLVGSYVTSLEMAGCSLTVSMASDDMLALWDDPVHTAALRWRT